jgi:hypothetical protein
MLPHAPAVHLVAYVRVFLDGVGSLLNEPRDINPRSCPSADGNYKMLKKLLTRAVSVCFYFGIANSETTKLIEPQCSAQSGNNFFADRTRSPPGQKEWT